MSEKKRILFVDDDRNVLDGLRRMLHSMRDQWKMEFVTKPLDALEVMKSTEYDVIISDFQMPGMDGVELLEKVRKRFPNTIRFMLSSYSDQLHRGRTLRCVHQFVTKPCHADQLKTMVARAFALNDRIRSKEAASVLSSLRSLPVMPKAFNDVLDMLNTEDCSPRRVGKLISNDIGMSAKILQLVNSSFASKNSKIVDPIHAVSYLGLKAVEALMLTQGVFAHLSEDKIKEFHVDALQEHCARVGALAKAICKAQNLSDEEADAATMAGILHDAGKIILVLKFPDEFKEAIERSRATQTPLNQVEKELMKISHAELGGCLLDLWGLPNSIIEATTFHHEPWMYYHDQFSVISAVYTANVIDHYLCSGCGDGYSSDVNIEYIDRLGVSERWPAWCRLHLPVEFAELEHVGK